ncbi:WG repeat-containing protein [Myroides sp. LJL116]
MRIYFPTLVFLLISLFAQGQVALEDYNSASSNEEYIEVLQSDFDSFKTLVRMFERNEQGSTGSKVMPLKLSFNPEEYQAYIDEITEPNIRFTDGVYKGFFTIDLQDDPFIDGSLKEIKEPIYLKKVYYYDGSVQNIEDQTNINSRFNLELGLRKAVSKIDLEIDFSAISKIDSLVLPAKLHQKATYNGVNIEVVEVSDKSILLKTSNKKLDIDQVQGQLKNKERLSSYQSQRTGMHPDQFEAFLKQYLKDVEQVLAFAKKNSKLEYTEFKKVVENKISQLEKKWDDQDNKSQEARYLYYAFGEPIDQLVMYFNSEIYEKKVTKTLVNYDPKDRFIGYDKGKVVVYNKDLKALKELTKEYASINSYFFSNDHQYFYLDVHFEMQPLTYYSIEELLNDFVLIQEDDESPQELVDRNNTKIMKVDDYEVSEQFNNALIRSGDSYYVLSNKSVKPKHISNVDKVTVANKGYFIVQKKDKYGFADAEGKIIVPIMYQEVIAFYDNADLSPADVLFGVKHNNKWGFVDANNKTVIPFIYSEIVGPFSYGIAPVSLDDVVGLINLKNQKISEFIDSEYYKLTRFGKREMSFSDGTFNYKGERK